MTIEAQKVKDFWPEYRAAMLVKGVSEARAAWCVTWAQRFARAMPGVPLRARTAEHVSAFLSGLEQQAHLEPWQVHQAQDALRLLYQACLRLSWARPWPLPAPSTAAVTPSLQARSFRDAVSAHEREAPHQEVLGRLRTELRARHYVSADGTGVCALDAALRDLSQAAIAPDEGPEAVKEYLAYLAEARKVSASTQNQALNALVFLYEQVLGEPLGAIGEFTRAKRPKRLPVVLTRTEVNHMLAELAGTYHLMAG